MFNPYLIIIKDESGNILNVEGVKVDYTKEDYYIKVIDRNENELMTIDVNEDNFIEIPQSLGMVLLRYFYKDDNRLFLTTKLDLMSTYNNSEDYSPTNVSELIEKIRLEMDNPKGTIEEIELSTLMLKKSAYDKKARLFVESKIRQIIIREKGSADIDIDELVYKVYSKFYGMGVLQDLDDDKDVSEIMVNAYTYPDFKCDIYYTKTNQPKRLAEYSFANLDDLMNVFSRTIAFSKQELNNVENAVIEATRANGDRVNIIIPDASDSYVLNIRKFANFEPNKENMINIGTVNESMDYLLTALIDGKMNIGIGGEMGTGKTTFINYLLTKTKPQERKAVISTVKEIDTERVLKGHDIVILNVDENKGFTFSKLLRTSLRTTADRIIVPESRGEEFKQVYEANLKTKGNIFTAHATTDESFLDVCTDMYMNDLPGDAVFIKNKISKSIDIVIIMTAIDNKIRIKSISEIIINEDNNFDGLNTLYYWNYDESKGEIGYRKTGNKLSERTKDKLFKEGVPLDVINEI